MISSHYEAAIMMDLLPITIVISPLLQQDEPIAADTDTYPAGVIMPLIKRYD